MVEEKWQKAKDVLEQVKALYPEYVGPDNPYLLLAIVYRRLADPAAEHKVLEELAMRDGDAIPAYLRLMELDEAAGDWGGAAQEMRGGSWRSIRWSPLRTAQLARAAEHLGERDDALTAYRAVALLDDTDPAEVHYHLAKLLREAGKPREARREGLRSLEEAPRFRDAHQLLLELVEQSSSARHAPPPTLPRGYEAMTRRRLTLACSSLACWRSPPGVAGPAVSAGWAAMARRAAGSDPRGSGGSAELEGGRALQERCLYLCENRI